MFMEDLSSSQLQHDPPLRTCETRLLRRLLVRHARQSGLANSLVGQRLFVRRHVLIFSVDI